MAKVVNKGLKLRIFPDKDMVVVLEQNIGNSRFIWVRQDRASNLLYAFKRVLVQFNKLIMLLCALFLPETASLVTMRWVARGVKSNRHYSFQ